MSDRPGDATTTVETLGLVGMPDSGHIHSKFLNDRAVAEIRIRAKEFECIGQSPPQDHPHVILEMNNQAVILSQSSAARSALPVFRRA